MLNVKLKLPKARINRHIQQAKALQKTKNGSVNQVLDIMQERRRQHGYFKKPTYFIKKHFVI